MTTIILREKQEKNSPKFCFNSEVRCPKTVPSALKIISHKYESRTNYFNKFGVDIILSRTRPTFLCILNPKIKYVAETPLSFTYNRWDLKNLKIIHRFPARGKVSGFMKSFMTFNVMAYRTKCLQFVALQLRSSVGKDKETLVWITGLDFKYWI